MSTLVHCHPDYDFELEAHSTESRPRGAFVLNQPLCCLKIAMILTCLAACMFSSVTVDFLDLLELLKQSVRNYLLFKR